MRLIAFFGLIVGFGMTSCSPETEISAGNRTTMEVDKVFNGGTVIKGEYVTAKFNVKNTGDYPLVISEVEVGCKCTLVEKPKDPIAPGKTGVITAQVETDNVQIGQLTKTIRVVSNGDVPVLELTIKATVKRK